MMRNKVSALIPPEAEGTASELADLLGLSRKRVEQLASEGVIPKLGKGRFPILEGVRGYAEYLKSPDRRANKPSANAVYEDARAREIEFRIRQREERLLDVDEVDAFTTEIVDTFEAGVADLPSRITSEPKLHSALKDDLARMIADLRTLQSRNMHSLRTTGRAASDH